MEYLGEILGYSFGCSYIVILYRGELLNVISFYFKKINYLINYLKGRKKIILDLINDYCIIF